MMTALIRRSAVNLVETDFRRPIKSVLIIRSPSYQDIVIHVQYYSKPNRAWNVVCVKKKFVLRGFFLTRFYCTCMHNKMQQRLGYSLSKVRSVVLDEVGTEQ